MIVSMCIVLTDFAIENYKDIVGIKQEEIDNSFKAEREEEGSSREGIII